MSEKTCAIVLHQYEQEILRLRSLLFSQTGNWFYGFSSDDIAERNPMTYVVAD